MYAIVGAAGKIGYSTSLKLREAGVPVRAILRNDMNASKLSAIGCDIVLADLRDPAALGRAIAGADAVQIILPAPLQAEDAAEEMRGSVESLVAGLDQARPALVLAISDYGAHLGQGFGMPSMFHLFEEHLNRLEIPKVLLRSAEHMEGWGRVVPAAIAKGILPSMHHPHDKNFTTVSAQDVGLISADLLLRPRTEFAEQIVHAEGPRRYCANDVAAALSQLLGRTITAQALPRSQWQNGLERALSPSVARLIVDLYDAHNKGGLIDVEPNGEVLRGTTELIDALRPIVALQ